MSVDLVLLSVGGVQRFIAESRKTTDMAGASIAMRQVVMAAARVARDAVAGAPAPAGLVFPAVDAVGREVSMPAGVTNKVAFLAPVSMGPVIARRAHDAARNAWRDLVARAYGRGQGDAPETLGVPDVSWVCVTGDDPDDSELWERARLAMVARRRSRVFTPAVRGPGFLCGQSAAVPAGPVPASAARHERQEKVSAAVWTKRAVGNTHYPPGQRFPSTSMVASTMFRRRLLLKAADDEALAAELRPLVARLARTSVEGTRLGHQPLAEVIAPPGLELLSSGLGSALLPEAWTEGDRRDLVSDGVDATLGVDGARLAGTIGAVARRAGVPDLTRYYAVVVQDLDRLGQRLRNLDLEGRRRASRALIGLGDAQVAVSRTGAHQATPVYAGGDDFIALVPAASALPLASRLRRGVAEHLAGTVLEGVTASTAVVFAHVHAPLRRVVAGAQKALSDGKDAVGFDGRGRDALAVVVLRRGGERARTVLPWTVRGEDAVSTVMSLVPDAAAGALSARLASSMEDDRAELESLADAHVAVLRAEVRRRVARQGGDTAVADALVAAGQVERVHDGRRRFDPVPVALVARFLAQECR